MATKKPAASYHHGDLRQALLDAALAVIDKAGIENFSVRDVARRAGVSPAAPYRHFADKDALLTAVAAECSARLGAAMDRAQAQAGGDPMETFRRSGIAYVRFAFEHPAHFRVMSHPVVARQHNLAGEVDAWMRDMRAGLKAAQKAGYLQAAPVDQLILFTHATVHGLAWLVVNDPTMTASRVERLATQTTELVGVGLLPR